MRRIYLVSDTSKSVCKSATYFVRHYVSRDDWVLSLYQPRHCIVKKNFFATSLQNHTTILFCVWVSMFAIWNLVFV